MPAIGIACVGLATPLPMSAQGFTIECDADLNAPQLPRFQSDFDALTGCLYHLGGGHSVYELLSEASRDSFPPSFLEFSSKHVGEIRRTLASILSASPLGRMLFASDWQFGPEWSYRFGPLTLEEFWRLHESRTLYLNTAYLVVTSR